MTQQAKCPIDFQLRTVRHLPSPVGEAAFEQQGRLSHGFGLLVVIGVPTVLLTQVYPVGGTTARATITPYPSYTPLPNPHLLLPLTVVAVCTAACQLSLAPYAGKEQRWAPGFWDLAALAESGHTS